MKIIDLLNKIANGEIPKHIRYNDMYMTYDETKENYYDSFGSEIDWKYTVMEYINDEIEIIEDTPKEEKKMKKYIGKIYYDNGIMAMEIESTETLGELTNWAIKSLKSETFTLITDRENKVNIFNSKNVIEIEIKQLKD